MSLLKKAGITFGVVGLTLLGLPTAASAGDTNWDGLYGGVVVGYGSGSLGITSAGGIDQSETIKGLNYGVIAGWNQQNDNWVYGLEADFSGSSVDVDFSAGTVGATADLKWVGNIRARAGVLTENDSLLYATAGLAFTDIDVVTNNVAVGSDSASYTGWTIGGGYETSLSATTRARVEYLYTDYGSQSMFANAGGIDFSANQHTVRAGIVMSFGQ